MLDTEGTMDVFKGSNGAGIIPWRVKLLYIMILGIFRLSSVLGQEPVMFQYGQTIQMVEVGTHGSCGYNIYMQNYQVPGIENANIPEITNDDIICLGDFTTNNAFQNTSLPCLGDDPGLLLISPRGSTADLSGRCLYKNPVRLLTEQCTRTSQSFSTMFQVRITPGPEGIGLEGLAFIIAPDDSAKGGAGGYLGWLNSTTNGETSPGRNFAVEIDFIEDQQFQDPAYRHVGVDINNLTSVNTSRMDIYWSPWPAVNVLTVWIDYSISTDILDVFLGNITEKPRSPIMSSKIDLTAMLTQGMFLGFSGSISKTNRSLARGTAFQISAWTFNSNGPAPDLPRHPDGTLIDVWAAERMKQRQRIITILGITIPSVLVFLLLVSIIIVLYRRNARLTAIAKKWNIDMGVLDRGPENFKYKVLSAATNGFSSHQFLGRGGFGSVYKGQLLLKGDQKPTEIAVKQISSTSEQGAQEFLAEVKIIGQVRHRNLVRLLGWCHDRGDFLLVYDYMPKGSVDQHLYNNAVGEPLLTWSRRLKIMFGVATALAFLHEEWEKRVIHRDVKSSNVMLDHEFNARLGDFGLARLSEHDQQLPSTTVAGTRGYLAPELGVTFRPTEKTDVYSFGAMVLGVATGKKPMLPREDRESLKEIFLVDWVWGLYRDGALLDAADGALRNAFDQGEMILFLKIGLLCCHPNPDERPEMRQVLNIWKGSSPFPPLPRCKPVQIFPLTADGLGLKTDWDTTVFFTDDQDSSPSEKLADDKGSSPNPTLRYRPRTSSSLPF